jgi:hypothetical protein
MAYSCASGATNCSFAMPAYDQTGSSLSNVDGHNLLPNGAQHSMLCGPVSATMALQAQLTYTLPSAAHPNPVQGWTATNFSGRPWANQVLAMYDKTGADDVNGTVFLPADLGSLIDTTESNGVSGRYTDFAHGAGHGTSYFPEHVEGGDIEPHLRAGQSVVVLHGHYTQVTDEGWWGCHLTYYSRHGGHYMAYHGFSRNNYTPDDDSFMINDPWWGQQYSDRIATQWDSVGICSIEVGPVVGLGFGYYVGQSAGTGFEILEGFTYLGAINK